VKTRSPRLVLACALAAGLFTALLAGQRQPARAGDVRACGIDDLAVMSTDARRAGADVLALTALGTWGTTPCRLREELTVDVKPYSERFKKGGALRGIRGAPAAKRIDAVLKPGGVLLYSWKWRNWCGHRGSFTVEPAWGGDISPSQAVKAPTCESPTGGSRLMQVADAVPRCSTHDYRVPTDLGQPFMTFLIDFVQIVLRKSSKPCLLRNTRIKFAVQGRSNGGPWKTLTSIRGNPARRVIGGLLTRDGLSVFWAWGNWCGGGDSFRAFAQVNGRSLAGPEQAQGATCEDSSLQSTLKPSYGHL
jgi:hypothetical protein